ncbi:MAG TPA: protein kinase [Candidatus Solibacter sp.]|nr:protein kinase [Candidatus Solibacter sp.]
MTREQYERLLELFEAACAREEEDRSAFLDQACAGDPELRHHVEKMLAADQQPIGLLEKPLVVLRPATGADRVAPDQIGPYRIQDKLGDGGMGVVFLAHDTRLNRPVAIKFLHSDMSDAAARRRFQLEARAVSSLNHPHILTVHDAGEWDDRQYLVMEYLQGGTLRDWSRSQKRSWREIVELLIGVADGLATAHSAGILHRDIKPGNILIHPSGYAKIADFGLAKLTESPVREDAGRTVTAPTRPGAVIGTIPYMSPEQASGRPLDARSDLFSFGIVLYEILGGSRPFSGASDWELLQKIIHEPAPRLDHVPSDLCDIVEKALAKQPAERYPSMQEMVADLRRLVRQTGESSLLSQSDSTVNKPRTSKIADVLSTLGSYAYQLTQRGKLDSLAVLPLENLSGDSSQEYFADGITDELIGELARIPSLHVISRTSVMRYKGARKTVPEIARELKVDAIVEGTVSKAGNTVRISAKLIRARGDQHLWSQKYERDLTDVLTLQADVARSIASEIQGSLKIQGPSRPVQPRRTKPEAYQAFLQGNYFLHQNIRGIAKSMEWFRRAIELDPNQAAAYAGLAEALIFAGIYDFRPPAGAYIEARGVAQKALELDESSADAHNALADVNKSLDWDFAGADNEYRRALQLSPSHLLTRLWYADSLSRRDRHDEALAESAHAVKLDPVSALSHNNRAMLFWRARRYDEAIREARTSLELDPSHVNALWWQGLAHAGKLDFASSLECLGRGFEMSQAPVFLASLGYVYGVQGEGEKAVAKINELERLVQSRYVSPTNFATVYAGLGDADATFSWMQRAFEARDGRVHQLVTPCFDRFRSDPRYRDLRARIGLESAGSRG